jgi:ribulose-5-phosphate 4-epimerase/fuculose-1-phosphate aldolase
MLEGGRLEFAEQNALYFYGRIAYNDVYDGEGSLDASQGDAMAQALPPGVRVLLLKSHGVVVVGSTVGAAYTDLFRLERACRAQVLAMSTGRPLQRVTADAAERIAAMNDDSNPAHFDAMKRVLDEREPDYAS